jgi:alcohol dehydrogenase class IV
VNIGDFIYVGKPARVIFGSGTVSHLREQASALGMRRALVLSTPQQEREARLVLEALGENAAGTFTGATMHTPVEVTERAMRRCEELNVDGLIAIGGGSTTGLGKAIAFRTDLPQLVIPTTYAGSEMTDMLGETSQGQKKTLRSPKVLPETVIYDIDLTLGLPVGMSVTSGVNAMAHAVEALYARDGNPVISLLAEEGIRSLARGIDRIVAAADDRAGRRDALYGAWLCATCMGSATMGLHHKLCHTLGGMFNLPHAETHAVVLPHAIAYNAPAARDAVASVARALAVTDAAVGLHDRLRRWNAPMSLRDLGMAEDAIALAAEAAVRNPYANPRPIEATAIRALIDRAWRGSAPAP